jgi:hypothetical protein
VSPTYAVVVSRLVTNTRRTSLAHAESLSHTVSVAS